jgi:hypothetical protein
VIFAISFSIIAGNFFFYKVLICNKLSAGVDRMTIIYMLSTTKIIAVFIWFHVVGVYMDHLQLMRCTLAFNH